MLSGVLQTTPQQSSVLRGAQLIHSPGAAPHSYGGPDRPPSSQPALRVLLINTGGKHETCRCFASFSLCAGPA